MRAVLARAVGSSATSCCGAIFKVAISFKGVFGNTSTTSSMAAPLILASVEQGIGEIKLNRPRALNSLNYEMVTLLHHTYRAWSQPDAGVRAVLLSGMGDKAFCAGGDVKSVAQMVMASNRHAAMAFFKQEYLTNAAISTLQMPHISLLDGITMGGGAGLSMHGHFRVATERTVFAMPECAIGLFPDVGMMALLPRLPGELGCYLALTGARLTGADVKAAGLATHYIPSSHLHLIKQQLQQAGPEAADLPVVNRILTAIEAQAAERQKPGVSSFEPLMPIIRRCFGHQLVGDIVATLQAEKAEQDWCQEALKQLQKGSPLSAALTLAYYHKSRAKALGPLECLEQDSLLCGHLMAGDGDFTEGVRARLIDKDEKPRWKYTSHGEVPAHIVKQMFTPRDPHDVLNLHQAFGQKQHPYQAAAPKL